jgi:chemotaxis protein MotB
VSRKKKHEHVNHERWLVSYADFITLLFAFFVVLFASSQSDRKKQIQIAAVMQTAFTPLGTFEAHAKTPPLSETATASAVMRPAALAMPFPESGQLRESEMMGRLGEIIRAQMAARRLPAGSVTVRMTAEGLVISLNEIGFFDSGSAEVRPEAVAAVAALASTLPDSPLRVEGHTDNMPIHTAQFGSNWELSSTRASAIARLLLERGTMHPANVSAAGFAEFHPVASNASEEGRRMNRRVDVIVLRGLHQQDQALSR